jgi:hypothetical protein
MGGGLIQISAYGSQDLYLTGTPEITFFKIVYRRHTNFSMESIRINFDNTVGFGQESILTVPKVGDLIHKTYLEVVLPKINFKRSDTDDQSRLDFEAARTSYLTVLDFLEINRTAFVGAFDVFQAENTVSAENMKEKINSVFVIPGNLPAIEAFIELLTTQPEPPFRFEEISMASIADKTPSDFVKQILFDAMTTGIDKSIKTQNFYRLDLLSKQKIFEDDINENLKFAWVDRVGHAIIEDIEVRIGGHKIDRHLGDWLNIWYELTANRDMEPIYNKMIGNIKILTIFDRTIKPQYRLKIPLQFWFCRHNGLSIPLIALEYHDVTFHVKFRNIEEVSYIEENKTIFVNTSTELFLNEVPEELGIDIQATMLIDYIYIDRDERRRFAQASHEYLIEQVQMLEIRNVNQQVLQCVLNNFVHPSKEIIWVAQKQRHTLNATGYTKLQWDNYSLSDNNKGNPIKFATIDFHSYNRVSRRVGNYFNYVQPYEVHSATPSDGINTYSFSINPEEHQPSGSANLSRLSRVMLTLEFNKILFPDEGDNEPLIVRIYTRNFNILRFINGLSGTAYTYG